MRSAEDAATPTSCCTWSGGFTRSSGSADRWWVVDTQTTYGTWIDGRSITEHRLSTGDRIALGPGDNPATPDDNAVVFELTG